METSLWLASKHSSQPSSVVRQLKVYKACDKGLESTSAEEGGRTDSFSWEAHWTRDRMAPRDVVGDGPSHYPCGTEEGKR